MTDAKPTPAHAKCGACDNDATICGRCVKQGNLSIKESLFCVQSQRDQTLALAAELSDNVASLTEDHANLLRDWTEACTERDAAQARVAELEDLYGRTYADLHTCHFCGPVAHDVGTLVFCDTDRCPKETL